jgi:hypothetical protein
MEIQQGDRENEMSHYDSAEQVQTAVLEAIRPAAQHNSLFRNADSPFYAEAAEANDRDATLIAALYVHLDECYSRQQVEDALRALGRAQQIVTYPESAQYALTDYDRDLALHTGGQDHHWLTLC